MRGWTGAGLERLKENQRTDPPLQPGSDDSLQRTLNEVSESNVCN